MVAEAKATSLFLPEGAYRGAEMMKAGIDRPWRATVI